jgi:lysyl-tRNA synthetase class 2
MAEQPKQSERIDRLAKLEKILAQGIDPYPAKTEKDHDVKQVLDDFVTIAKRGKEVTIAGRLRSFRQHGNISFADLQDYTGQIQIAFSKKEIGEEPYRNLVKLIDMSDFVQVSGSAFTTQAGQQSIMAKSWKLLTKALRPLPDKHAGFKDEEERLRKRYLDILMNPEVKTMLLRRDDFWNSTRKFLKDRGFVEVETPILEALPGGADARPFVTHHNALDLDVYLRISTGELWQKKLMVAGLGKTFEIGRQFRNEGMDAEHLQDYTQMEFYWGYANYEMGMALTEELYKYIAKETFGTLKFKIGKFDVNLGQKWEKYDYVTTIKKHTGIDVLSANEHEIEKKLQELKIEYDKQGFNITRAIDNLWKYCRKQLGGPGFLVGVPITVSPLAKRLERNTELAQRFQIIIAGSEMGNGYSELNDPIDQAKRFEEQQALREAGDDEAMRKDDEFVEALEYGMPPTCGFGFSERLFSFLNNKPARECQIFPLMKPKSQAEKISEAIDDMVQYRRQHKNI